MLKKCRKLWKNQREPPVPFRASPRGNLQWTSSAPLLGTELDKLVDQGGEVECQVEGQVDPQEVEVVTPTGDIRVARSLVLGLLARMLGLLL